MRLRGDVLSHENSVVYDTGLPGMDGYDSAPFFGTNTMWRREALDSIGGFQYGTISEDFWRVSRSPASLRRLHVHASF